MKHYLFRRQAGAEANYRWLAELEAGVSPGIASRERPAPASSASTAAGPARKISMLAAHLGDVHGRAFAWRLHQAD